MLLSTRFLESSDSVRFKNWREHALRKAHLEIEILLSILFGDRVATSSAYSFDSVGFVQIASEIIQHISGTSNDGIGLADAPIILGLRQRFSGFRQLVAEQVKRDPDEFILTGWPSLSPDRKLRNFFAADLTSSTPEQARYYLRREFERENLEAILRLDSYFTEQRVHTAVTAPLDLNAYVRYLLRLDPYRFIPGERDVVHNLQQGLASLRAIGVDLSNRSVIRTRRDEALEGINAPVFDGILEYIDTAYNLIINDSLQTVDGVFSSRVVEANDHVSVGERLAYLAKRELTGNPEQLHYRDLRLEVTTDAALYPSGPHAEDELRSWRPVNWDDVLRFVRTSDFQVSLDRLRHALAAGKRDLAEKLLDAHVILIASVVRPYFISRERSFLMVTLTREYTLDSATALGRLPVVGSLVAVQYLLSSNPLLIGAGATASLVASAIRPVSDEESQQRLEGTIQSLSSSVRVKR